jgi:Domain of unknown function (DUF1735)
MFYKLYHQQMRLFAGLKNALLVCLIILGITSCKKDMNAADSLQSRFDTGMVSYVQGANVVALNGVNYSFTPYYVGVPVSLKETTKSAETVTASVDPSLVTQYNELYQEKNPVVPHGAFEVSHKGNFSIDAGSAQAKDSLYVVLNDGSQLKDSTIYLVPVTLTSTSAKLRYSLFFFKVLVTKGDLLSKVYGATVATGISRTRSKTGSLDVVVSGTIPDSLKFRLTLNKVFPAHDVSIQATMLTQDEVNTAIPKEQFAVGIATPDNTVVMWKDLVNVPAKLLLSRDSLTVRIQNKEALKKSQWYIAGLKIKTYTGSAYGVPPVANDSCRAYIRFFNN